MAKVPCPKCGAENLDTDPQCLTCGAALRDKVMAERAKGQPVSQPTMPGPKTAPVPAAVEAAGAPPDSAPGIAAALRSWGSLMATFYSIGGGLALVGGVGMLIFGQGEEGGTAIMQGIASLAVGVGLIVTGFWLQCWHKAGAEIVLLLSAIARRR